MARMQRNTNQNQVYPESKKKEFTGIIWIENDEEARVAHQLGYEVRGSGGRRHITPKRGVDPSTLCQQINNRAQKAHFKGRQNDEPKKAWGRKRPSNQN